MSEEILEVDGTKQLSDILTGVLDVIAELAKDRYRRPQEHKRIQELAKSAKELKLNVPRQCTEFDWDDEDGI